MRVRYSRVLAAWRNLEFAPEAHCSEVVANRLICPEDEVRKVLARSWPREKLDG